MPRSVLNATAKQHARAIPHELAIEMDEEVRKMENHSKILVPTTDNKMGWKYVEDQKYQALKARKQAKIPGVPPRIGNNAIPTLKSNLNQKKQFNFNQEELDNINKMLKNDKEDKRNQLDQL